MAIGLANKDNSVLMAELYANKDGTIVNEDAFDQYFNINDRIVKFPQKDKCVFNLSSLVFSVLSGCGFNAYLNRASAQDTGYSTNRPYDLSTFTRQGLSWGSLTNQWSSENANGDYNNVPTGQLQYSGLSKTLFKPDQFACSFNLKGDWNRYSTDAGGNKFTFSIRFRTNRDPIWGRSLIRFSELTEASNAAIRIELDRDRRTIRLYSRSGSSEGNFGSMNLREFNTLSVVVEGTTVKCYLNGVYKTTGSISLGALHNMDVFSLGSCAGSYSGASEMGCNMEFASIRLWDCALTDSEVMDVYKIDRAGW